MVDKNFVDITKVNHIDIANQIDNDWSRDTIIAFKNEQKNSEYTLRFKNQDKSILRKKFINPIETESTRRHNTKVVNLMFGYMIFKVLTDMKIPLTRVLICPDHRPTKEVHHYIQKIANFLGKSKLINEIQITFINRRVYNVSKGTPAHRLAKKVLKGKRKSKSNVNCKELDEIISKLL
ncbi:hypothetical protein KY347_05780 [Candidatus Woesearchaeota archaeon]|nr:hypothetical protein [Candidatus Woesearchaeota archaeon]